MEIRLFEENPTTGDSGASIEERLERMLSAESPQAATQPEAQAEGASAENTEKPEGGEPEKDAQPQLTTSELAKIFGVEENTFDVDADGSIHVKTKIDGKEGAAKFADLVKSYQLQGHAENRARAVAEQEKALQSRMQEVEQAVKARVDHVEQLANVAGAELLREYQSINWNALRQADAGQYAALQADFANRKAQIQGVFQNIQGQRQQQAQQFQQAKAQYLAQEAEKLPQVIPEWKDAAVREKEAKELIEWGLKKGFSREQINGLNESSALHVAIVRQAMLFDRLQSSKAEVENKVRQAPKIVKPGQAQANSKDENLRSLKQTVAKTGGKNGSLESFLIAKGIV
jgi:hypothetical protein